MHTTEDLSARLRADLTAFIGTENWHRIGINRQMLLTDGVKYFAETAGCYWFLDIVATEVMRFHGRCTCQSSRQIAGWRRRAGLCQSGGPYR